MKVLKSLRWIILLILLIVVLVAARLFNKNLFRQNAENVVLAVNDNMVFMHEIEALKNPYLIVDLNAEPSNIIPRGNSTHIPFEKMLDKNNRELLEKHDDQILLFAGDISVSSKAWVILNQLGFDNIFILAEENPDVLKYKFQPDTMVEPELSH